MQCVKKESTSDSVDVGECRRASKRSAEPAAGEGERLFSPKLWMVVLPAESSSESTFQLKTQDNSNECLLSS